jgi:hypothetical protein
MRNLITTIAGLLFATMPALALEPGGTVTGTIDGQEVELTVYAQQSDHGNSHISLYIIGEALGERGLGALALGAEWIGDLDGTFSHAEVSIENHANPLRIYFGEADEGLSFMLTSFSFTGNMLEINCRVAGVLTKMDRIGQKNPDPDDTLSIDLTFDAILEKL